jgi:hypothetical protein
MILLQQIAKTREYLDYLEEYVNNIQKAWKEIQHKCKDMNIVYDDFYYNWINNEVHWHDASVMSEEEFTQCRKKFYPTDIEKQEAVEKGVEIDITTAFEHHKAENPHHWENWTKLKSNHPEAWCVHCTHMVIDWMAMGYKFGDTAQQYYEKYKEEIKLPDYAIDFIYEIFKRLNQQSGEYRVYMDGGKWCAVGPNFISLQESPAGFGDTPLEAMKSLEEAIMPKDDSEVGDLA